MLPASFPAELAASPFFAAAILLLSAGAAKLRRPQAASRALSAAGVPAHHLLVRLIGSVELLVGAWCLVAPAGAPALALAAVYLVFAVFLCLLLVRRVPAASCGCTARGDLPPSWLHVGLNFAAAGVTFLVSVSGMPGIVRFASGLPLLGIPFLAGTLLTSYLAYLAVVFLPELLSAALPRRGPALSSSRGAGAGP